MTTRHPSALRHALAGALAIAALNQVFTEALRQPVVRQGLSGAGLELRGGSAQELADLMRQDGERYGRFVRELKITAD